MDTICPGCGLSMPAKSGLTCRSYYHVSPECWDLYTEVLAAEYSNAFLFGRVHQLTVDAYAVQHAGGNHPDKSVTVHLMGLHFAFARGVAPMQIAPMLQQIASHAKVWPHFEPVVEKIPVTVFDIALCSSTEEHIQRVRDWASSLWNAWAIHHSEIAHFVSQHTLQHA